MWCERKIGGIVLTDATTWSPQNSFPKEDGYRELLCRQGGIDSWREDAPNSNNRLLIDLESQTYLKLAYFWYSARSDALGKKPPLIPVFI